MAEIRQIALLAAGCQPWNKSVVVRRKHRFAYAATLSIYIYEMDSMSYNFHLHSIMSEHKKVITALDWHPKDDDILASASADPSICVWNIAHQSLMALLTCAPIIPTLIAWLPDFENQLIYLEYKGPFFCWKFKNSDGSVHTQNIHQMKDYPVFNSKVTCISLCKVQKLHLAVGHEDGTISIYIKDKKPQRHLNFQCQGNDQEKSNDDESNPVTSIQWDPLSSAYILVASGCSNLYLLDTSGETITLVNTYVSPSKAVSISSVAWLPEAPGSFVSADVDVGILRIWNVSKTTPLENLCLKQTGFLTFCVLPGKKRNKTNMLLSNPYINNCPSMLFSARIICLFIDGGVGVYDLNQHSWDFCREMGHTETIFDCQFNPKNCDLLATGSYDGTIKVWNINTMEAVDSSPGNVSIIYSVCWAPGELNSIAAGTSNQGIIVWNLEKRSIVSKILTHGNGTNIYCVAWNQKDARKIASGGADRTCMVHQCDGGILLHTFKHPNSVYGCDWHPNNESILVTSCEDKNIRIYYVSTTNTSPLKILSGHTAKVFRVKWAPLKEGILCSGSDDCTIRIWDYGSGESLNTLTGHTHNVRGLQWHLEFADILISGSWDFTIRVWDVSDGACLNILEDHGGDVYGLSCHPKRPFLLASTSRDSTVRLWSLFSLASIVYLKILVHRPWEEIFKNSEQNDKFLQMFILSGQASRQLKSLYKFKKTQHKKAVEKFSKLLCPSLGVINLWDLVSVHEGKDISELSDTYGKGIIHHKHLLNFKSSEAQETELVKMARFGSGGIGVPSREECLRNAAKKHLLAGNLKRYCELKVEIGEWKDALIIAPGVSLNYWTSLTNRWCENLLKQGNDEAVPALMATGNSAKLLQFYRSRGDLKQAYCIAAALAEGIVPMKETQDNEIQKSSQENKCNSYVKEILHELSEEYFNRGSPISAACCDLAADDVQSTLIALVRGNELELAVSVGIYFEEKGIIIKSAVTYLAWRCVLNKHWDLAMDMLNLCPETIMIKAQICIYCELTLTERNELHRKVNLPLIDDCLHEATMAENNNISKLEVVKLFLLSSKPSVGLEHGVNFVREKLFEKNWKLFEVWDMLQMLGATRIHILHETSNELYLAELLLYSSYVGGIMAMCHKYYPVVEPLLLHAVQLLDKVHSSNVPLSKEHITSELSIWKLYQSGAERFSAEQEEVYINLMNRIKEPKFLDVGVTKVTGSNLPHHSAQHICYLTEIPIQGPVFFLESGKLAISLNDAIMWAKVNPFSPLGDGQRIIPF